MRELDFMKMMWGAWERRGPVSCAECGLELQFHPIHCAHILGKGANVKYRKNKKNLMPMCKECHGMFDHGLRRIMLVWKYCKVIISKLKLGEYDEFNCE